MREKFNSQRRRVVDAPIRLTGVLLEIASVGRFLRSRGAGDLSILENVLAGLVAGGLCRTKRQTWKGRDAVDFIFRFTGPDV